MERRLIWTAEKVRGVPWKRAACSQCGWVSEMRHFGPKGERPTNTGAIRLEFLNHKMTFLVEFADGTLSLAEANDQGLTTNDQFNVGRQRNNRFRIPVHERCTGAEHWVGDNSTNRLGGWGTRTVRGSWLTTKDRRPTTVSRGRCLTTE
jgi:hypothetical protein